MANFQTDLTRVLTALQDKATRCANAFTTPQLKVEYRVAFSAGAALPWRLMELHRGTKPGGKPWALRRMHCFRTAESLQRSIHERTAWKAQDQALVASHLVKVRASTDQSFASPPAQTAARPYESKNVDLRSLTPARLALRAKVCLTVPDRVVDLPNG